MDDAQTSFNSFVAQLSLLKDEEDQLKDTNEAMSATDCDRSWTDDDSVIVIDVSSENSQEEEEEVVNDEIDLKAELKKRKRGFSKPKKKPKEGCLGNH